MNALLATVSLTHFSNRGGESARTISLAIQSTFRLEKRSTISAQVFISALLDVLVPRNLLCAFFLHWCA